MSNIINGFGLGLGGVMGVGTQGKLGSGSAAQQNTHYNTMLAAQNAYANNSPYATVNPWQTPREPVKWMFDGEYCTITEFAEKMWPSDCKEKTFFLLKYTGDTHG